MFQTSRASRAMFIQFEALPLIPTHILSQGPSEAGHDDRALYDEGNDRSKCSKTNRGFPSRVGCEGQPEKAEVLKCEPMSWKLSPSAVGYRDSGIKFGSGDHECERVFNRLTTSMITVNGPELETKVTEREISEKAEETVRIMEWTKEMVIRCCAKAREEERQMVAVSRFGLLLSKWRSDAKLRDINRVNESIENMEEGELCRVEGVGDRRKMGSTEECDENYKEDGRWSFPLERCVNMEKSKARLWATYVHSRRGLALLLG